MVCHLWISDNMLSRSQLHQVPGTQGHSLKRMVILRDTWKGKKLQLWAMNWYVTFHVVNQMFGHDIQPSVKDCVINHRMLTFWMPCRKWKSFQHKTVGEGKVCHIWCYPGIWLSTFVLWGIIAWSSADVNMPQCCLQCLLKEDSLSCPLNSSQKELVVVHDRDLCQVSGTGLFIYVFSYFHH